MNLRNAVHNFTAGLFITHLCWHVCIYLFIICLFIYLFIDLLIYLFIYLLSLFINYGHLQRTCVQSHSSTASLMYDVIVPIPDQMGRECV
jgi:hypothetical protein